MCILQIILKANPEFTSEVLPFPSFYACSVYIHMYTRVYTAQINTKLNMKDTDTYITDGFSD